MPKANIETQGGTKIVVEGTTEEVSGIIAMFRRKEQSASAQPLSKTEKAKSKAITATNLIENLREEGFFDKKRGLLEVKKALDEQGHIYPVTTLSGLLIRLTRKRILRRLKEGKRWVYVKGSG